MAEEYYSSEIQVANGGSANFAIPPGIAITGVWLRFKGISSYPWAWGESSYSSGVSNVVNGGSSSGGTFGYTVVAASCRYIGKSTYTAGAPVYTWTGWNQGSSGGPSNPLWVSVTVPSVPSGGTFITGTIEFVMTYHWDGVHSSSGVQTNFGGDLINDVFTANLQTKTVSYSLSAGHAGATVSIGAGLTYGTVSGYARARIYYSAPGSPVELKTANCSNNYGGGTSGNLNNGQSYYSNLSSPPSGNFSHSIGGSGQAQFQYFFTYQYQYQYELQTANPYGTVNGYSGGYGAPLGNGVWSSWIELNAACLVEGQTNTITFSIGGSGAAGFILCYEYDRARPVKKDSIYVRNPGSTQETPLVATNDAELDIDPDVRCYSTESTPTIRAWDLVETYDGDASKIRIRIPSGTKAVRKVI